MLNNYLQLALRKLSKHRDYAFLNVLGLGLSVACGILIFMHVRHHLSFDDYHQNADRIARIVMDIKTEKTMRFAGVPTPMAKTLREEYPIFEKTAICAAQDVSVISVANTTGGTDKFNAEKIMAWTEPNLLEILDLPLVRGDVQALREPNTALITEKLAQTYFGNTEPLGKIFRVNNEIDLRVIGILQNLPENTDYTKQILGSWATVATNPDYIRGVGSWSSGSGGNHCFVRLQHGHNWAETAPIMAEIAQKHPHRNGADFFQYKAMPLVGLHFDDQYGFKMNRQSLWVITLIGLFLLITGCVNFINMATAQALDRSREVGIRKSLGSTRDQLFWQFIFETGIIVAASLVVGFLLAYAALPLLNTWMNQTLRFSGSTAWALVGFAAILGISLTFLSGFYPGWILARFNPVASMHGVVEMPRAGGFPIRKTLVTTQFFISQILIIGAVVVTAQMKFAQDAVWGYRPGEVLTLPVPDPAQKNNLQQQLTQLAGINSISLCEHPPATNRDNFANVIFDNRKDAEQWLTSNKPVDARYFETFGLQLVAGRNLQPSDTIREFVVNETFVKKLNLRSSEDNVGKMATIDGVLGPIVGVVRDFHHSDLSKPIEPVAFGTDAIRYSTCAIQLAPGNPTAALTQIQKTWETLFPNNYYEHKFMDERIEDFLKTETMVLRLVRTFAGIAIFIGCLGLYGLATFMVARKRKEVGIRKTLGASITGLLWLFGKEYAVLIGLAFLLAAPVGWWATHQWLQDFAYRAPIGAGVFFIALLATVVIATMTVGVQSVRAALADPVESLRSE